jgi:hypothetical protein
MRPSKKKEPVSRHSYIDTDKLISRCENCGA